ncbi:hypothetical protein [Amycolatopsis suaedae]|uniref:Uncharacterized protein n=1 Tax=Amycolatopsis suaedae TaxID=2510978 RepID=A0A4Q7J3G5_9PSEU|nr:hypothetical protein [Amycolatopsis suaedae]RZQ62041.1 hypothetical protein EWH70_20840 [Amycolatopsis suaedae]
MNFSQPVGAAAHARALLCEPGEPLLWAAFATEHQFDVRGLTARGEPKAGFAGAAVVGAVVAATNWGGDDGGGSERLPDPDVVVFGGIDSLAHRHLRDQGVGAVRRLWALTPARLAVAAVVTQEAEEPASLLGRAGRLVKVFTDNRRRFGGNTEGEPVRLYPGLTPVTDVPRAEIARIDTAKRKGRPCVRVSLVDESGFDLLFADDDPQVCEWMVGLGR